MKFYIVHKHSLFLFQAIACYDYESTRDDELTFREDTIIFIVAKNDDGWFEGVIEPGIRGLFPVSEFEFLLFTIGKHSPFLLFRETMSNLFANEI